VIVKTMSAAALSLLGNAKGTSFGTEHHPKTVDVI
jgi:hypothetical protein